MVKKNAVKLFEETKVRVVWDSETEEWYFSIIDVIEVLTESPNPRKYWSVLKTRLKKEGNETATNCSQLKMLTPDGKMRLTDVATTSQLFRLIQSVPSLKAEPFKLWMAQVAKERLDQIQDPELSIEQAMMDYKRLGYYQRLIPIILLLVILLAACTQQPALPVTDLIRLNQVGYYPGEEKIAVVDSAVADSFYVRRMATNEICYRGYASDVRSSALSDKRRTVLDFNQLNTPDTYVIELKNVGTSYPFEVKDALYRPLAGAAIRAFYYQRTGMPIEESYAGKWHRPLGHPDTCVLVHPNAVSPGRPAGTVLSSPKGWYDAGDYNKYIVNSAYSIGLMLALAEDAPEYIRSLSLNIPESNNTTPDLLDELHYNLDWMFTMQDPADGGVYHKLTTPHFEGFIKPTDCEQQRYVVRKSVTAALDFAAAMAQASRVFAPYEKDYPGFSAQALDAARKAYAWALKHPGAFYQQDELNKEFTPEVLTGAYGDRSADDEFFWASVELYTTTGDTSYLKTAGKYCPQEFRTPGWATVAALGYFTLLRRNEETLGAELRKQLLNYCDQAIVGVAQNPFVAPYGNKAGNFFWGCLSEGCANQAIALLTAYRLTGDRTYLTNGLRNANYILGCNATGYCYVTGFGTKSPMYPHHRLAASDDIDEPLPGFLVGGPNPGQQDKSETLVYPTFIPDESYVDVEGSYASNEIAINWNASLVYLATMIDELMTIEHE